MKAIITGATGGLGRNLGEFLIASGWEVVGFGRNKSIGKKIGYKFKAFDLSDKDKCLELFEKADVVFHCAALSSPWGAYADFYQANVIATKNVVEAMKKYQIAKMVFVSTSSIYFDFTSRINIKESYLPKKFVNNYTKTKYLAEQVVLEANIFTTIIRPRGIFGKYDSVLVPRLEKIANKGFLPIIKNKEVIVDITYAPNVAFAMFLMATKEIENNLIFNITNDENLNIKYIFSLIMEALNKNVVYKEIGHKKIMTIASVLEQLAKLKFFKEPLITKYGVGLIANSQTLNIQKAKDILGYYPKYSIKQGIESYAKSRD